MNISTRISHRVTNAMLVILTFVLSAIYSLTANAQSTRYRGLEGSFGVRSMQIQNLPENGTVQANLSGGQVGFVTGNEHLLASVGVFGYYESDNGVPGSVRLYESSLKFNFYPMSFIATDPIVQPYLVAGISYDRLNFSGYYLHEEPGTINYSSLKLPDLGKVKEINAMAGAGMAFRVVSNSSFVQIFTEVKYGYNLAASGTKKFADTNSTTGMIGNVGVRFGMQR